MNYSKYISLKRYAEFILALIIILAALPFSLITALVLSLILKTTPVIKQERGITAEKNVFFIYKFRTIRKNNLTESNSSILYKNYLEDFVPPFCRWLRRTGLDELPQLINVVKGEMSIIGPRPFMLSDLNTMKNNFSSFYNIRNSIIVKPGITGLWQVTGRRDEGIANLIRCDAQYDKSICLSLDLKIFFSTIPLIIKGKHSDAIISNVNDNEFLSDMNFINFISNEG